MWSCYWSCIFRKKTSESQHSPDHVKFSAGDTTQPSLTTTVLWPDSSDWRCGWRWNNTPLDTLSISYTVNNNTNSRHIYTFLSYSPFSCKFILLDFPDSLLSGYYALYLIYTYLTVLLFNATYVGFCFCY